MAGAALTQIYHATTVAFAGNAVFITGKSGSGKSGLGLTLLGFGATLVSDDKTILERQGDVLVASAPRDLCGLIEARNVGLLRAETALVATVALAVDMNTPEVDRLPARREVTLLGCKIPLLHCVSAPHFAAAILQILKAGRSVP